MLAHGLTGRADRSDDPWELRGTRKQRCLESLVGAGADATSNSASTSMANAKPRPMMSEAVLIARNRTSRSAPAGRRSSLAFALSAARDEGAEGGVAERRAPLLNASPR